MSDFARLRSVALFFSFVSPFAVRVWFVVAAAMRLAVPSLRPFRFRLVLMCSYWRSRFALFTPRGGIAPPPSVSSSGVPSIRAARRVLGTRSAPARSGGDRHGHGSKADARNFGEGWRRRARGPAARCEPRGAATRRKGGRGRYGLGPHRRPSGGSAEPAAGGQGEPGELAPRAIRCPRDRTAHPLRDAARLDRRESGR